jgi:hypothetical protein
MDWKRATKSHPCVICGGGIGWCMTSPDGTKAVCGHVSQGCLRYRDGSIVQFKNGQGYVHAIANGNGHSKYNGNGRKYDDHMTITECRKILDNHKDALTDSLFNEAKESLGLHPDTLRDLEIGYDERTDSFSFPLKNGKHQPIGIRTRRRLPDVDGKFRKCAIKGSRNGIIVPERSYESRPPDFLCDAPSRLILIPEGPTDVGACIDLGFRAVGRPSNCGGEEYIKELLLNDADRDKQDVVIIADNDKTHWTKDGIPYVPGAEGALKLADAIYEFAATLRIVKCPKPVKDIREWLQGFGNGDAIQTLIDQTETLSREKIKERLEISTRWQLAGKAKWDKEHCVSRGNNRASHDRH